MAYRNVLDRRAYDLEHRDKNLAYMKAWHVLHRDAVLEKNRRIYREDPSRPLQIRAYRLRAKYGITNAEYDALLAAQDGLCLLCKKPAAVLTRRLHVDHDHVSGKVRGLLCHGCNTAIGSMGDDPSLLRAAADYIEARR